VISLDSFKKNFMNPKKEMLVKYARVDPNYTSGRPRLIFDGEDVVSGKQYPYLSSYQPTANDRVMLLKNVILDKII
jgi:hypothetical protein